jgi:cytochrome P450
MKAGRHDEPMDVVNTQGPPEFPMPRDHPFEIAPGYSQLRETQPIARVRMPSGKNAWLVTKYEYVRRILSRPQVSVDRRHPGYPVRMASSNSEAGSGGLTGMDPPDHAVHRRLLIPDFTVKQVLELLPRTQEMVDDGIRDLLAAGCVVPRAGRPLRAARTASRVVTSP